MDSSIKTAIILAPHPDDGEFGCGGTLKKLTAEGVKVYYIAFSPCTKSLPEDFAHKSLYKELEKAVDHLGISQENLITYDFPVREFPANRQDILEILVQLKREINPDLVFLPNSKDIHQDHQTIHNEGLRAFKHCRILGYELPWNNTAFNNNFYVKLDESHLEAKVSAIREYKSQDFRNYKSGELFYSLARVRGTQSNNEYAEAFETIKWKID